MSSLGVFEATMRFSYTMKGDNREVIGVITDMSHWSCIVSERW